jgi:hypothetical protein
VEDKYSLEELGWDMFFAGAFASLEIQNVIPGRVVTIEKDICGISMAFTDDISRQKGVATSMRGGL